MDAAERSIRRIEIEIGVLNQRFDSVDRRLSNALRELTLLHLRLDAIGSLVDRIDRRLELRSGGEDPRHVPGERKGGWTRDDALFEQIRRIANGNASGSPPVGK